MRCFFGGVRRRLVQYRQIIENPEAPALGYCDQVLVLERKIGECMGIIKGLVGRRVKRYGRLIALASASRVPSI